MGFDNDYYWLHAASLSIRMQVDIDEAKLSIIGRVIETAATRVNPLLSNNVDREEGRFGGIRTHSLHTIQTRTSISGIEILRSMDLVNLLIAPDANPGPLDWVVHQVGGEFISSGTRQPIESTTWRTTISTLGASWQDQGCLSCDGDCEVEKCLRIKTTNATPLMIKNLLQRILMTRVLDEELDCWHAAITEFFPSLSYSLLSLLANPSSIDSWSENRQILFLALET